MFYYRRSRGAKKVYAYSSHGIFSDSAKEKLSKELDLILVSNSIPQENYKNIEVIPLNELFAEAIYRTNEGLSLSELFE